MTMTFRRLSLRALLLGMLFFSTTAAAVAEDTSVKIKIGECEESLAVGMPGGMSSSVELEGAATLPECAAVALGQTKQAITESKILSGLGRSAAITVNLLTKVTGLGLTGEAASKVVQSFLESGGTKDGFFEKLGENAVEQTAGAGGAALGWKIGDETTEFLTKELAEQAFKYLKGETFTDTHEISFHHGFCDGSIVVTVNYSAATGTGEARISASGDCHCTEFKGGVRVGRFSVIGVAPISFAMPVKQGGEWTIPCRLEQPRYYVWAPCCQRKGDDNTWVSPETLPPAVTTGGTTTTGTPPPGQDKERTDYTNINRSCDPTGRRKEMIRWNERRLAELYARNASRESIEYRKAELAQAKKDLCACLDQMANNPAFAGAGIGPLLEQMRRDYCMPPVEPTATPSPTPPSTAPQDPCLANREAYESALAQLKPNDPNSQLRMVRAKQALCDCLEKKYGGTLPPALQEFCDPKAANRPSSPPVETALAPRFESSPVVLVGGTLTLRGPFDGTTTNTSIKIGDQPCTVVSETRGEAKWQLPEGTNPGNAIVTVQEGATSTSFPVTVLGLTLSAARLHLLRGESTTVTATVSGLDSLPAAAWRAGTPIEPLDQTWMRRVAPSFKAPREGEPGVLLLVLENGSKDVVSLAGSKNEAIALTIARASVQNGQYQYQAKVNSMRTGDFDIQATLVPFLATVTR